MSVKRLAISMAAVLALLVVAGVVELFVVLSSHASEEGIEASESTVAADTEAQDSNFSSAEAIEGVSGAREIRPPAEVEADLERKKAQRERERKQRDRENTVRAIMESGSIVFDGVALSQTQAEQLVAHAQPFTMNVGYIDQRAILPSGCEIIALTVALRAQGYDPDPVDIADHYLLMGGDFTTEYIGSPKKSGGGFPPCIADAANAWLAGHGDTAHAHNLTGTSFDGVATLVALGYPVLIWVTERFEEPQYVGSQRDGMQWYRPEHCVVLYGIEDGQAVVSDSLEGQAKRDLSVVAHIYEACGRKSLFVLPE